jgi:type II secretory pathway pseudopilin PulG
MAEKDNRGRCMKNRIASRRFGSRWRSALTLVELVVVMVVLIALAGMTLPLFDNVSNQARVSTTTASLRQLQDVILNRYAVDMKGASDGTGTYFYDGLPRAAANPTVYQPQLEWLFKAPALAVPTVPFNATTRLGWNGPYLAGGQSTYPAPGQILSNGQTAELDGFYSLTGTATFGNVGDQTVLDGWGNPIVIVYITEPSTLLPYYILLSAGQDATLDPSISTATPGTPVPATITLATSSSPRTLTIGAYPYLHWLPLQ